MKKTEFYQKLADILEMETAGITGEVVLKDISSWDSLAMLSFVAFADSQFGVVIQGSKLAACRTVNDLISLLPGKVED